MLTHPVSSVVSSSFFDFFLTFSSGTEYGHHLQPVYLRFARSARVRNLEAKFPCRIVTFLVAYCSP